MPSREQYTVGWICALHTEYVAACQFLDQVHPTIDVSSNDNNAYTLGCMNRHYVVIAVLPDGEYGTSSAAGVARDMVHSFPNIRIGLMVGIGGGAPTPSCDIRLGDVVVSSPRSGTGAVFQYDYGKSVQHKSFEHIRLFNQPPPLLRTAVSVLRAKYESDGHQLVKAVDTVLQQKSRLRRRYGRPSPASDRLYNANYVHPMGTDDTCTSVCQDLSQLVARPVRSEEDNDDTSIHYGPIASANQLMKDALARDALTKANGVLCFEMEAAGLMNFFPCLVVRGICDYADSHKNKEWQGYAAMMAAAYVKDLLRHIAPTRVENEVKINETIRQVTQQLSEVHGIAENIHTIAGEQASKQHLDKVRLWLNPADVSTNYEKARAQRHRNSGTWYLRSKQYIDWKTNGMPFTWLSGIPGCGKTVLSSTVIEDLTRCVHQRVLLYFFFDSNDYSKQSHDSMIRSLVHQLYFMQPKARQPLHALFSSCHNGERGASSSDLEKVFSAMLREASGLWIVLDALDECRTRSTSRYSYGVLPWIRQTVSSDPNRVHILATSRDEEDIRSTLSEWVTSEQVILIRGNALTNDIYAYVRNRIDTDDGLRRWQGRPEIQSKIQTKVAERAGDMFRLAACQLDALHDCLDLPTLSSALEILPEDLDRMYDQILDGLLTKHKQYTLRLLQFLTYTERPLSVEEAVDAIPVDLESDSGFDPSHRLPLPLEITRYCSSLVTVTYTPPYYFERSRKVLQLAHLSVREYLTSGRVHKAFAQDLARVAAKACMANVCIAYLLNLESDLCFAEIRRQWPFAQYAATHWMALAGGAGDCRRLRERVLALLSADDPVYRNCFTLYEIGRSNSIGSPLCYASAAGLVFAVEHLLRNGADMNVPGGTYRYPLHAALENNHQKIFQLLLEYGANPNVSRISGSNVLQAASAKGCERMIQMLVDHGVDINSIPPENYEGNALEIASNAGHEKVVMMLLDQGATINARTQGFGSPLVAASRGGREKVVRMLLDQAAKTNVRRLYLSSALAAASGGGYDKLVEVLLDHGASVENDYALLCASNSGHASVLQMLLDRRASLKWSRVEEPYQYLRVPSEKGYDDVVEVLLDNGADVNVRYPSGVAATCNTALQVASINGHDKVVRVLLEYGANVNYHYGFYGSALHTAAHFGHLKTVQVLLDYGAKPGSQQPAPFNAQSAALRAGHKEVLQVLRDDAARDRPRIALRQ